MSAERFIKLVEDEQGFEFIQAYRNDEDRIIGGKGNIYWYIITKKGKVKESYIGKLEGGVWKDSYVKGAGAPKDMPSGTTIDLIAKNAFLIQGEYWVKDRKGKLVEDSHPHLHYVYGFGDKAVDVSEKYGVTIAFSDIKDDAAGFHLRDVTTGSKVELP